MPATVQGMNLTKAHRAGDDVVYALQNVSIEVHPGEFVAVLGRSGSGKSTLLHTLGCLRMPDSGTVCLEGSDVSQLDDEEVTRLRTERVGFLFEAFNLLPNETVGRNVDMPLRHQGIGAWDRREKAEEALRVVGLANRMGHMPGQLSAHQRQLVTIARAIIHDPAIIFADEPTRNLDSTSERS